MNEGERRKKEREKGVTRLFRDQLSPRHGRKICADSRPPHLLLIGQESFVLLARARQAQAESLHGLLGLNTGNDSSERPRRQGRCASCQPQRVRDSGSPISARQERKEEKEEEKR
jgi:hypothetical protein